MRRFWYVLGGVGALAVLVLGPLAFLGAVAHEERTVTRDFDAAGISVIALDLDDAAVTVVGDQAGRITVQARVSRGVRSTPITIEPAEGRLQLASSCHGPLSNHCHVTWVVHAPPSVRLTGTTSDTSVDVTGISGGVDLTGSDGDVVLDRVTGPVGLDTTDGDVDATRLGAGPVTVDSHDGAVGLEFEQPPTSVVASSSDGDVTVVVPDGSGPYRVEASSGDGHVDTSVRTDPAAERHIRVESSDGAVAVRYASG